MTYSGTFDDLVELLARKRVVTAVLEQPAVAASPQGSSSAVAPIPLRRFWAALIALMAVSAFLLGASIYYGTRFFISDSAALLCVLGTAALAGALYVFERTNE